MNATNDQSVDENLKQKKNNELTSEYESQLSFKGSLSALYHIEHIDLAHIKQCILLLTLSLIPVVDSLVIVQPLLVD